MTQAEWNAYALSTSQSQQLDQDNLYLDEFKARQEQLAQEEYTRINTPDDADSAENWRIKGGDSPEIFHDIHSTGTTDNARSKVYKQIAYANNIPIEEAVKLVDGQAEAYKTDQVYRQSEQLK